MQDKNCAGDYFTYVARGDKNCGCKTDKGPLSIRSDPNADYFEVNEVAPSPVETSVAVPPIQEKVEVDEDNTHQKEKVEVDEDNTHQMQKVEVDEDCEDTVEKDEDGRVIGCGQCAEEVYLGRIVACSHGVNTLATAIGIAIGVLCVLAICVCIIIIVGKGLEHREAKVEPAAWRKGEGYVSAKRAQEIDRQRGSPSPQRPAWAQ
eukprot:gnl/TRDRNA2_/TRDRNA2_174494_c2_seq3.p1 gnl/TRDRNA2_/TRDRNA2_174494_c2~~gnl/TRDRNA2_/TRDRNA2_174494_c2_seq3.p1  ORF type:complete len:205 (-),score=26.28 gnl/TRDRNA2_/TRDRNA2_174494_c2_seq3:78-692(-)